MRLILFLLTIACLFAGGALFMDAKSAIHEITAALFFVMAAIFLSGSAITEGLFLLRNDLAKNEPIPSEPEEKIVA